MARDWVEQVNEDRAKRFAGQPASDRVMQMQTAPLTPRQQQSIPGYESGPPAVPALPAGWLQSVTTPAAVKQLQEETADPAPSRRTYDAKYPKGKGPYPLYPSPEGLYTPGGPQNEPYPGATQDRRAAEIARGTQQRGGRTVTPGSYMSPGQADMDLASRQAGGDFGKYRAAYGWGSGNDDPWAFRDKIRGGMEGSSYGPTPSKDIFIPQGVGGKPGEQVTNDYGPGFNSGYGTTRVMATADKNGMFNSFSDVPGAPVGPGSGAGGYNAARGDPYGIGADIARSRMRATTLRGTGSNVWNNIQAAAASRSANKLAQVQQAHDFARERFGPGIAMENAAVNSLLTGGLTGLQDFQAARSGHPNIITSPGIEGNKFFRPRDVPEGGLSVQTMPTMPGAPQQQPQVPQPLNAGRTDMNLYFDPSNPYR